ncbi:hypothetical protein [Lysobacter sp. 1R34A]|uniref:hypothetical protein n=1 Tax=Lysobacter sp. 1R34A TaxID=3445786 RepID=UPI003EEF0754
MDEFEPLRNDARDANRRATIQRRLLEKKSRWGAACWEIACGDRAGLALRSRP